MKIVKKYEEVEKRIQTGVTRISENDVFYYEVEGRGGEGMESEEEEVRNQKKWRTGK